MNKEIHERLLRFIEEKMNQGRREDWTNGDFDRLSNQVRKETKVYLSTATLKRIFGKVQVKKGYTPHRSTLEALKQFVDYEKRSRIEELKDQQRRRQITGWGLGMAGILIVTLAIFLWPSPGHSDSTSVRGSIDLDRLEGSCPSTAFFNLELDSLPGFRVKFGDESPKQQITPKSSQKISHFYAYPGLFRPQLWFRKQLLAHTEPVLVETQGWQAFAHLYKVEVNTEHRYHPIKLSESLEDGVFHPSKAELAKAGLDTTDILVVRLDNYAPLGVSADEFVYQARLKNDEFWPGVRCYSIIVLIQGTEAKVEFKLVAEGCSGYAQATLGDSTLKFQVDLLPLALDVGKWNTFEVSNKESQVSLKANGEELFSGSYAGSLGEIVGTSVIFHGSGSVDYIKLSARGQEILSTPF